MQLINYPGSSQSQGCGMHTNYKNVWSGWFMRTPFEQVIYTVTHDMVAENQIDAVLIIGKSISRSALQKHYNNGFNQIVKRPRN